MAENPRKVLKLVPLPFLSETSKKKENAQERPNTMADAKKTSIVINTREAAKLTCPLNIKDVEGVKKSKKRSHSKAAERTPQPNFNDAEDKSRSSEKSIVETKKNSDTDNKNQSPEKSSFETKKKKSEAKQAEDKNHSTETSSVETNVKEKEKTSKGNVTPSLPPPSITGRNTSGIPSSGTEGKG
jgi:hypothetical protein